MKIVNIKGLLKFLKKEYGNFYTVEQLKKMIEEYGANSIDNRITYLNFGQWSIKEEKQ